MVPLQLVWQRLKTRSLHARHLDEHLERAAQAELRKCLGPWDLSFLGLGSIIGAGVFVLSGVAANENAGPAVIVSYAVAATAALLAALSYAEFAVELPVAGGAFNYVSITFGELAAWLCAWNMCLETTLSSAAVARGFASYTATLFGLQPSALQISVGPLQLDPAAFLLIMLLSALLAKGTKESSMFNIVVSGLNVASILFVLVVGFPQADPANMTPFAPYGARGVFSAAGIVFFSYVGFDYVANAAEEASNPKRDMPIGIMASLGIATLLYVLMSAVIVLMVPYNQIDIYAPFSAAFQQHGMGWASRVVSAGAVLGIVTSAMTGLLGQTRLYVVLGRERLLPAWLADINSTTGTPVKATLLTGAVAGALALVLDIGVLAELVSIGTLFVFWNVCSALLYRRYYQPGSGSPRPVLGRIAAMSLASIGFSASFALGAPWLVLLIFLLLWLAGCLSLLVLPVVHTPERFRVPMFPLTPSLGILFTIHLIGSLGWPAYVRFAVWIIFGLAIYAQHGVHAAEQHALGQALAVHHQQPGLHRGTSGGGGLQLPARLPTLEHEGLQSNGYSAVAAALAADVNGSSSGRLPAGKAGDKASLLPAGQINSSAYDADED